MTRNATANHPTSLFNDVHDISFGIFSREISRTLRPNQVAHHLQIEHSTTHLLETETEVVGHCMGAAGPVLSCQYDG